MKIFKHIPKDNYDYLNLQDDIKKTGDDILKEWLDFREENLGALTCKEDKEHFIYFEEISKDILNNVSGNNIEYKKS